MAVYEGTSSLQGAFMTIVWKSLIQHGEGGNKETQNDFISSITFRKAIASVFSTNLGGEEHLKAVSMAEIAIARVAAKAPRLRRDHFPDVLVPIAAQSGHSLADIAERLVTEHLLRDLPLSCKWMTPDWYQSKNVQSVISSEYELAKLFRGVDPEELRQRILYAQDRLKVAVIPGAALDRLLRDTSTLSAFTRAVVLLSMCQTPTKRVSDPKILREKLRGFLEAMKEAEKGISRRSTPVSSPVLQRRERLLPEMPTASNKVTSVCASSTISSPSSDKVSSTLSTSPPSSTMRGSLCASGSPASPLMDMLASPPSSLDECEDVERRRLKRLSNLQKELAEERAETDKARLDVLDSVREMQAVVGYWQGQVHRERAKTVASGRVATAARLGCLGMTSFMFLAIAVVALDAFGGLDGLSSGALPSYLA